MCTLNIQRKCINVNFACCTTWLAMICNKYMKVWKKERSVMGKSLEAQNHQTARNIKYEMQKHNSPCMKENILNAIPWLIMAFVSNTSAINKANESELSMSSAMLLTSYYDLSKKKFLFANHILCDRIRMTLYPCAKHFKHQLAVPVCLLWAVFISAKWTGFVNLPLLTPDLSTHFPQLLHVLAPISSKAPNTDDGTMSLVKNST